MDDFLGCLKDIASVRSQYTVVVYDDNAEAASTVVAGNKPYILEAACFAASSKAHSIVGIVDQLCSVGCDSHWMAAIILQHALSMLQWRCTAMKMSQDDRTVFSNLLCQKVRPFWPCETWIARAYLQDSQCMEDFAGIASTALPEKFASGLNRLATSESVTCLLDFYRAQATTLSKLFFVKHLAAAGCEADNELLKHALVRHARYQAEHGEVACALANLGQPEGKEWLLTHFRQSGSMESNTVNPQLLKSAVNEYCSHFVIDGDMWERDFIGWCVQG